MRKVDILSLSPATHRVLRDMNEVMVLNVIRERQPVSRIEIAELIGLEGSTVSKIVARLLESQLIYEEGLGEASPQGGRKKRFLHINPHKTCAVGIDMHPSGYTVAVSDFNGKILHCEELPAFRDPLEAVVSVARCVRVLTKQCSGENIGGIGVSLVGLIDPREGRVLAGEGLGWGPDVPVGAMLEKELNLDLPIYYENSAWLCALAEIWFGKHSRPPRNLVFLDVGEGIGGGIVIRGQLYHGSLNGAGEFGHIPLNPEGPACSCGAQGCLEAYAAEPATVQRYHRIRRSRRQGPEDAKIPSTVDEIVRLAAEGETEAMETLRQTAAYLGRGLVPVVYSINPEVIVLGGPIIRAWDTIQPVIRRELSARTSSYYLEHLTITPTTLAARPSLVGAIALVLARTFAVPSVGGSDEIDSFPRQGVVEPCNAIE
jgi:predicted NBD/HSP70 family sugar kinase